MSQHRSDTAKNRPLLSKRLLVLLLGFLYLLLSLTVLEAFRFRGEKPAAEAMREASERTAACFSAVKEERLRRGYEIPAVDDPNLTGLLGYDYTEITTSHGSLEAKRSTANPNTAAMITDFLLRSGVREGDPVCVNLSSSFPCLNIAVLCSLDTLGAKGVVINSIGASTYGANIPGFVYMDMEHLLFEKGLIRNHSQWFSMGGDYDTGYGMPDQKLAEEIRARIASYGPELLWYPDIRENLEARERIYREYSGGEAGIRCFINVGGNILAFAGGDGLIDAKSGLILPGKRPAEGDGLIPYYLNAGVPVIHLLNMNSLLPENGLPFDPVPLPSPGEGDVYYEMRYRKELVIFFAAGTVLLLAVLAFKYPRRRIPF